MASQATLASLAMLKVNIDQGKDYLEYLRPFILQILVEHRPDPVTDKIVGDYLRHQFGLEIPERAVQIVLKRISRTEPLRREQGIYRIVGQLSDPKIGAEKAEADRHIVAVINDLTVFSRSTAKPIEAPEVAVNAICAFLSEFDIPCLKAYLRGTAIPKVDSRGPADVVLVSEYVIHLQQTSPERFESFMVMVQGHMIANSLLCPDLQEAPKTYRGVTFYLDTPLLVQRLGLEGSPKKETTITLIALLRNLGGSVATFSHSREELARVIKGAAEHLEDQGRRGAIVIEARRNGTTKSDLLLTMSQIDTRLAEAGIEIKETPPYSSNFQIDETAFEEALDDELSYFNPRAREFDINSVRAIYDLREGAAPTAVERCQAVLVSSNLPFAIAAYNYSQRHEETLEVSSVITDFSLANMAWLKAPLGAPNLPRMEILAFSYAALRPSKELLDKYLTEIEKLEKVGGISARDHQLLRCSLRAQEELMRLTLGDEAALTGETVTETLRRVTQEITHEERQILDAERAAHEATQNALNSERGEKDKLLQGLYWRSRKKVSICVWAIAIIVLALLIAGGLAGMGMRSTNTYLGWILFAGTILAGIGSLFNLIYGTTLMQLHDKLRGYLLAWFLRNESKAIGLKLPGGDKSSTSG